LLREISRLHCVICIHACTRASCVSARLYIRLHRFVNWEKKIWKENPKRRGTINFRRCLGICFSVNAIMWSQQLQVDFLFATSRLFSLFFSHSLFLSLSFSLSFTLSFSLSLSLSILLTRIKILRQNIHNLHIKDV